VHGSDLPIEEFPALSAEKSLVHCFVGRVPGIDVTQDKAEALRRLESVHRAVRAEYGLAGNALVTAQQIHGNEIAVIDRTPERDECFPGCDGLMTNERGVSLGIYVADCCAVFLVDPVRKAIGLLHSGKKGTELGIVGRAIDLMGKHFGSVASDLIVQLSPCIRPPHYEIDFAANILSACRERGVRQVHDSGVCTACHLDRYYSYRAEKGRTGRMLALLAIR
jgi:copper oxidase (laccase) domain-containing protein